MKITWLGHSCFSLEMNETSVVIDPFISGNPRFPTAITPDLHQTDFILLTHGHEDHLGDAISVAKKGGATIVAVYELAHHLMAQGVKAQHVIDMNIGGGVTLAGGVTVHMVQAMHSNSIMVGDSCTYGGCAAGFVVEMGGVTLYHAGDTGVFSDMKLIQDLYQPTIGLLPIGDRYTMGPKEAAYACNELFDLKTILPMHYGTFPQLTGQADTFKNLVRRGEVVVLNPGQGVEV
ncbi:MAG: metal-dependent hydrolase [Alphaproteobacteria bacterium]|nr:metal-dependent hydrolase [Alphaproteobacteria bacterium]